MSGENTLICHTRAQRAGSRYAAERLALRHASGVSRGIDGVPCPHAQKSSANASCELSLATCQCRKLLARSSRATRVYTGQPMH